MNDEVDLIELNNTLQKILQHVLNERSDTIIQLGTNFYWHIPDSQIYDVDSDPTDMDIGSLVDDWEFCRKIASSDQEPLANNLVKLSSVIRRVGEILGEEMASSGG